MAPLTMSSTDAQVAPEEGLAKEFIQTLAANAARLDTLQVIMQMRSTISGTQFDSFHSYNAGSTMRPC